MLLVGNRLFTMGLDILQFMQHILRVTSFYYVINYVNIFIFLPEVVLI